MFLVQKLKIKIIRKFMSFFNKINIKFITQASYTSRAKFVDDNGLPKFPYIIDNLIDKAIDNGLYKDFDYNLDFALSKVIDKNKDLDSDNAIAKYVDNGLADTMYYTIRKSLNDTVIIGRYKVSDDKILTDKVLNKFIVKGFSGVKDPYKAILKDSLNDYLIVRFHVRAYDLLIKIALDKVMFKAKDSSKDSVVGIALDKAKVRDTAIVKIFDDNFNNELIDNFLDKPTLKIFLEDHVQRGIINKILAQFMSEAKDSYKDSALFDITA